MKILASILLFSVSGFLLSAQEAEKKITGIQSAVEFGGSYNYSGINLHLVYLLSCRKHAFYAGPKIVASKSYLPANGPWGLQSGYRYTILQGHRFQSFVFFDYQLAFWEPYNPHGFQDTASNRLHELHLGYGLQFRLTDHIKIGNLLGAGGYVERLLDVGENKRVSYSGFSSLVRLFAAYEF